MMDLAMMACDENGFVNPDKEKLLSEIWQGLVRNHGIVGIIGKPGEQIEGAVLLRVGPMWYSHDLVVDERAIFVHPDYRKSKIGRAKTLCEFSKKVADELGIPLMYWRAF
jgi:GNAT superfamily N-acetyltransferase